MVKARVFEGEVFVSYSQAYVQEPDSELPGMEEMFAGQVNGLCGAAMPGSLFLITGLHTGWVPFAVDVADDEPALEDLWSDIVEVSFTSQVGEVLLLGWGGGSVDTIALGAPGSYRVRYCGHGLDTARQHDTRVDDEPALDRYLLQFWPCAPATDRVVRQGSEISAYWHEFARALPPPPTAAQSAAAQQVALEQAEADAVAGRARWEQQLWGGRTPSERLRRLGGNVLAVADTNRDLLDSFASMDATTQRAAARWLARRAFERAELDSLDWVRPALQAMDRGDPLPPPFTDQAAVQSLFWDGPTVARLSIQLSHDQHHEPQRIHAPSFALPALFSAVADDPLQALVDTFSHAAATFENDRSMLIAQLRARFINRTGGDASPGSA